MKKIIFAFLPGFCLFLPGVFAQFSPGAGQPGSAAIHKDSIIFINWAIACQVTRGLQDISNASIGYASAGEAQMAIGKSGTSGTVSLGDGGTAVLTFEGPIINGPGYDFAVFENSFDGSFLELAFVEVSSNGQTFFRFPATCLTDTNTQLGTFDLSEASKLNNLAGKYKLFYGTPFDLEEMTNIPGLDVNHITHVKIIDVVGSLNDQYATRDAQNNKINDPFPTPFPQGGFDLDAVGVINQVPGTSVKKQKNSLFSINSFPNPVKDNITIKYSIKEPGNIKISLRRTDNIEVRIFEDAYKEIGDYSISVNIEALQNGLYILNFRGEKNMENQKVILLK
ncbi:MAG: T9SS C-terminal target domain-containing protein [Bacteroidetes bacterium]|nr:T9SS C-terminal target domain-containing protein [Bacteroidota bacterium]HET6242975.1 T9SS type A sorting domain-containing protein [Bacteroidia bacterium]